MRSVKKHSDIIRVSSLEAHEGGSRKTGPAYLISSKAQRPSSASLKPSGMRLAVLEKTRRLLIRTLGIDHALDDGTDDGRGSKDNKLKAIARDQSDVL